MIHYTVDESTVLQRSSLQIVLLLFSQDDGLARTVYKVRLQKVQWFSDRAALDISLGDLMLIVLIKSGFRNATAVQDEYVHTHSMSTMINLAPQAVKLSPVTTQRLCSCIEASHKRLSWLDQKVHPLPIEMICIQCARTTSMCGAASVLQWAQIMLRSSWDLQQRKHHCRGACAE